VTARVSFSSARKWSSVTFEQHGTWVLGAPGVLGGLTAEAAATVASHEAAGQRVVLLGTASGPADGDAPPGPITPIALLVLAEQLRDDAAATVRYLLDQGITVKVLSGDAPDTVSAIATRAGIPKLGPACDASGLSDSEAEVGAAVQATNVLGRVRPAQKLAAVKALQAVGHVVAMAGDGVNDVQALKQADLGIAIGSGSQASRSVARIVLLDSTFAAIPQVLSEGRRVISSIERVANLFVTKTVYAALLAISVALVGLAYPFFPRHFTIVSTLTIGIPGFLLALGAAAPRARPGFTRRVLAFTIPAGVAAAAATLTSYEMARFTPGTSAVQARTTALLTLLTLALWILALIARPRTPARIGLLAGLIVALGALLASPLTRQIFTLQLPGAITALRALGVAALAILALTIWRHLTQHRGAGG